MSVSVSVPPAPATPGAVNADTIRSALTWFTVRVIVVVFVKLTDVPVIVTVTVPDVHVLLNVSVSTLVVVAGFGLKEAVTPLGRPDADKLTLLLKPFCGATVIVVVALAPWVMLRLLGNAESV